MNLERRKQHSKYEPQTDKYLLPGQDEREQWTAGALVLVLGLDESSRFADTIFGFSQKLKERDAFFTLSLRETVN